MKNQDLRSQLLHQIEEKIQRIEFSSEPASLYQPYKYTMDGGGKRIRPLLTMLAAGMCGGSVEASVPAALAVEVLHNFTLVHDDIMDSADTRRGRPSVFKKWDENVAILSGDLMFADAMRFLHPYGADENYSKQEYFDLNSTFLNAIVTVCEGQAFDMEFVNREDVTLDEYIRMISGKTAALLAASLKMGGITAHATTVQKDALFQLGMEMGIAFQIQDDLLDATADPEKFGKRPGGDIFEGKKTYLTILALERANEEQSNIITSTLEASNPHEKKVDEVLLIMKELNVMDDVAKILQNYYSHTYQLLEQFEENEYKKELENLLIFLQNRDH